MDWCITVQAWTETNFSGLSLKIRISVFVCGIFLGFIRRMDGLGAQALQCFPFSGKWFSLLIRRIALKLCFEINSFSIWNCELFETVNVSTLPLMSQERRHPFWQGKHYHGCAVWADAVSWNIIVRHCLLPQFFQTRNVITVESGCNCFLLRWSNNGRGDTIPPSSCPRLAKCWPSPFYSSSLHLWTFFKNLA